MATNTTESLASLATFPSRRWRLAFGIERIFCALFDQFQGSGRVVFLARFSGPMEEKAIRQALTVVTMACPRANVVIQPLPSGDYEFRLLETPSPVSTMFRPVADADEGSMLAAELGQESRPPGTEPVLRWVVLPSESDDSFQIVGLAHHALFDAASMGILLRRFLQVLGQDSIPRWDWPEATLPAANWSTLRGHWGGVLQHFAENRAAINACPGLPRDDLATATCVIQRWTPKETKQLTQTCHQAGTTVTALLGVTGMFAVRAQYGDTLPQVDLTIPVNTRRFLPGDIADQSLGMQVVVRNFAIDFRKPVSLREESQRIAQRLRRFLEFQGPLRFFRIVNLLTPRRLTLKAAKPSCVSANSLGRLNEAPSATGVRWLECGWFANGGPHMPAFSQSAVTLNDCLTVTSYSSWIAGDRVRELAEDVDLRLRRFAGLTADSGTDPAVVAKIGVTAKSLTP